MTMSRSKKRAMARAHNMANDNTTKKYLAPGELKKRKKAELKNNLQFEMGLTDEAKFEKNKAHIGNTNTLPRASKKSMAKARRRAINKNMSFEEFKMKRRAELIEKQQREMVARSVLPNNMSQNNALKTEKDNALKKAKASEKPKAEPPIETIGQDVKLETNDQDVTTTSPSEAPTLNRDQKRMLLFLLSKKQVPLEEAMKQVQQLAMKSREGPSSKEDQESDTPAPAVVVPIKEPILIREIISIPKIEKVIPPIVTIPEPETPTPVPPIDETPQGRRVGLVAENPITDSEEKLIKDAIVRTVRAKKSDCPPEFFGIKNHKGVIIATVADQESEDWLMKHRKDISKECGIKLKVYKEQDIPSPHVFKVTFPDSESESNESILDTLESYSRHPLPTSHWIVKKRIIEGHCVILDLSVDKKSAKYFEERNYRLPYGLGHATVEKADNKKTKHKDEDVDEDKELTQPKKKKCKVESTDDQEYVFPIPTSYPIQQG